MTSYSTERTQKKYYILLLRHFKHILINTTLWYFKLGSSVFFKSFLSTSYLRLKIRFLQCSRKSFLATDLIAYNRTYFTCGLFKTTTSRHAYLLQCDRQHFFYYNHPRFMATSQSHHRDLSASSYSSWKYAWSSTTVLLGLLFGSRCEITVVSAQHIYL